MNGHQVPLGVGENTIKVKVTSEDDTMTADLHRDGDPSLSPCPTRR